MSLIQLILDKIFFLDKRLKFYTKLMVGSFGVLIIVSFYLWIFVKAIEKTSMLKFIKPTELVEGDWIAKDIIINKKKIAGPKDLGVSKKQIEKLVSLYKIKKIKKVLIKEGLPFLPSFLISYIVTLIWGNLIVGLIG